MPMSDGRSDSERLVSADRAEDDKSFELKLRPKWLGEFIGQEKAKEQLGIALDGGEVARRSTGSCAVVRAARPG